MKKIFYSLLTLCFLAMFISSCNKVEDNEYIEECEHINTSSYPNSADRSIACKDCCKDNGWENGFYNQAVGHVKEGCECFNE